MLLVIMAIRFIWEVLALIIFGIWGFQHWKIIGAVGSPLVVAVIWGIFGSPKAPYKLQGFNGTILELVLFSAAGYILYRMGHSYLALAYLVIAVAVSAILHFVSPIKQ